MANYRHVKQATRIPVPGDKCIEEIFGHVNTQTGDFSVAHMVTPPGWSEPAQRPEFVEITVMVRGRMRVDIGDERVEIAAGESLRTEPGVRVSYANPYEEESEYYAICIPAFSLDLAHREADE